MAHDFARRDSSLEFFWRRAHALGPHNGRAKRGQIVDTRGFNVIDAKTRSREHDDLSIENKAWIDTGAENGDLFLFRKRIELFCKLGLSSLRERHFFGDRHE